MSKTVLVHVCCAPCASYSVEKLKNDDYEPTLYFYNPNIHPQKEYDIRLNELIEYCKKLNYELIVEEKDENNWFEKVKGFEQEKEGSKRCLICFDMRLTKTAQTAKKLNFDYFTTVLTISPHKNSKVVNELGLTIAKEFDINFLEENFKKKDGFKKSLELSKKHNMYRQSYCGCVYSINP